MRLGILGFLRHMIASVFRQSQESAGWHAADSISAETAIESLTPGP